MARISASTNLSTGKPDSDDDTGAALAPDAVQEALTDSWQSSGWRAWRIRTMFDGYMAGRRTALQELEDRGI